MQSLESSLQLKPHGRTGRLNTIAADGTAPASYLPIANGVAELAAQATGGTAQTWVAESLRNAPTTAHMISGAVIGPDAEHGVVDRHRRAFRYQNLLVTDSSTVPGNVGVNPSLTITAMAAEAVVRVPAKASS